MYPCPQDQNGKETRMAGSFVHVSNSDYEPNEVLAAYPRPLLGGHVIGLGNRGGFSGAAIYRVDAEAGAYCLRAWPAHQSQPDRLAWLHRLMADARDGGLLFVPRVFATKSGDTKVRHGVRLWELQEWLPGRADFRDSCTHARLENACGALAQLHGCWQVGSPAVTAACPAVERRVHAIQNWHAPAALCGADASVHAIAQRARNALSVWLGRVCPWLEPWARPVFPLQPCLCDVWHDHILFEGDTVSGLVDFGAAKIDHVANDLARLLGSLVGDDTDARAIGVRAYARVRPLSPEEERLVHVLDVTAAVLGLANWLMWLYRDGKAFEDENAVARRMTELIRRVEHWPAWRPP